MWGLGSTGCEGKEGQPQIDIGDYLGEMTDSETEQVRCLDSRKRNKFDVSISRKQVRCVDSRGTK